MRSVRWKTYCRDMTISNVAVFCASADGTRAEYRADAQRLGKTLAEQKVGLIYGGANVGLMQAVADACLAAGGRVVGVIPEVLVELEVAHPGLTELHVTSTMHTRKALMGERADAFIILPGGFGTFEEMFEVLAWQTLGLHNKPIILLNTLGFYDGMISFLDRCQAEGMISARKRAILLSADSVDELLATLNISGAM